MRLQYPGISDNFDVCQNMATGGSQHLAAHAAMGLDLTTTWHENQHIAMGLPSWAFGFTDASQQEVPAAGSLNGFTILPNVQSFTNIIGQRAGIVCFESSFYGNTTYLWRIAYHDGTGTAPIVGSTVTGDYGDTLIIDAITTVSGSWGAGTATGIIQGNIYGESAGFDVGTQGLTFTAATAITDDGQRNNYYQEGVVYHLPVGFLPENDQLFYSGATIGGVIPVSMTILINGALSADPGYVTVKVTFPTGYEYTPYIGVISCTWPLGY